MVDFANYFWGDKHNGFNVLYQNMKNGQVSIKELSEFIKEVTVTEDDYQKHLSKLIKLVSNYGTVGCFSPCWSKVKNLLERYSHLHNNSLQKLHDVGKEVQKYGDEQQKLHKSVRESESKTMDAVNLMQTTTTCLQKAKENYAARFLEHEKLKKENALAKELSKSENRVKKAADEYKQYVDKYAKIRDNFEQRMITSTRNFQEIERNHLNQMKQLVVGYGRAAEELYSQMHLASSEFSDQVGEVEPEEILCDFAEKKGTGADRPMYTFEEAESVVDVTHPPPEDGLGGPDASSLLADVLGAVGASDALELTAEGTSPMPASKSDFAVSANGPTNGSQQTTANRKLALWLPGRKKPSSGGKLPTPTPSPSENMIPSNSSSDAGGFLRKKQKDKRKKDKENDNKSELSNEDAKSQSSGGKNASLVAELIDEEGYSIRPDEATKERKGDESSSDDDSDEDTPKKLSFQIKQPTDKSISASVDQLKDAFKDVNIYSFPGAVSKSRLSKEMSLDEFDPVKRPFQTDPWRPSGKPELLRPAKTGDDRYNTKLFAGAQWTNERMKSDEPWPDDGGDGGGTNSTIRSRPRSVTPTTQTWDAQIGRSWGANSTRDQPAAPETNFFASSPVRCDSTPLAVALTETTHVLFKGASTSPSTAKVYGSLTLSFPSAFIRMLAAGGDNLAPPLVIRLTNADKIQSLVPNRRVLPDESSFKSDSRRELAFDTRALAAFLKERADPSDPFFNLDVLRYEVRCEPDGGSAPLILQSFWKCQQAQTDIVVQYNYNSSCPLSAPLLNLQFSTPVDGRVTQAQLKPEGSWNSENNRLEWKLTELSRHGESSGALKARLSSVGGPSAPTATTVGFRMNDVCLSGADVQLVGTGYRISLLKKRLVAGRYLCEPETR